MPPSPRSQASPDRWLLGGFVLLGLAALATILKLTLSPQAFEPIYAHSSLLFPALPLASAYRAWRIRRTTDRTNAFGCVLLGFTGFFAYDLLWYGSWLAGIDPGSTPADFLLLVFAPCLLVGLLRSAPAPETRDAERRQWLDASIIGMSAATVLHVLVAWVGGSLRPVVDPRDIALLLAPVMDLVTLGGLALLWVRGTSAGIPAWSLTLSAGLACSLSADVWYALPVSLERPAPWFIASAWYISWATLAIGAAQATAPEVRVWKPGQLSRLPYLFPIACWLALAIAVISDHRVAIVSATFGSGLVSLLVLLRQRVAIRDVTRVLDESARLEAETRLAALVTHGSDLITILTPDLTVRYASPSHTAVTGVPTDLLVGRSIFKGMHRDDRDAAARAFTAVLAGTSERESLVLRIRHVTGDWRFVDVVVTNHVKEPAIGGLVLNSRDVTDRRNLEEQLLAQALRDPLTGLGNRRLFGDRVSHAMARQVRHAESVAVLLLDLDHFKFVNDTLGHSRGDQLLVAVAERLLRVVRSGDTVARLGGDEFAVLLEDLGSTREADATAERILEALDRPFTLEEREVFVRASIGIAWAAEGMEVDQLLTDADVAMYAAKGAGRSRVERFSTTMRAHVAERHDIEAALRSALDREEIDVVYQPLVDLQTGRIGGAEALVRWRHHDRGMILPDRFIPVAEESDLVARIGQVVLRRAALDAVRFRAATTEYANLRIAVNISAQHLASDHLVEDVEAALALAGVGGDALAVELTETTLVRNEPVVAQRLQELRRLGLRIALDDFGTGYSSLSHLRRFPIDVLKVDRSLVAWDGADGSEGVARAVVSIGQNLSLRTVGEGIETREQLEQLRALGCSLGQGFLFSRPLPRDAFTQLLKSWDVSKFAPKDVAIPA